jgi:DNA-directed RNA polymerase subunit E'/Rpb7
MSIINITEKIEIEPKYLNANIKQHILSKLKKNKIGKCTKQNGYVLSIESIEKYKDNIIPIATPNILFDVTYQAKVLKPEINDKFDAEVLLIYPQGIYLQKEKVLDILIPSSSIKNFKYDSISGNFKNNEGQLISQEDYISVIITAVHYEEKKYRCIAKLLQLKEE